MDKVARKAILRTKIIEQRTALTKHEVSCLSQKIASNLFDSHIFKEAGLIMVYMAFRNEVLTKSIIEKSWVAGKKIVLPYVVSEQKTIIPSLVGNLQTHLITGAYGILEPDPQHLNPVEPVQIDLVLLPGVAFDYQGNRLGYGGGYYDRFLPQCGSNTIFIALGYHFQVIKDLFDLVEKHDQKVHYVITDQEVLYIEC